MIYRTEHPKPQFMRENWLNLNGEWDFEIDLAVSGEARELFKTEMEFSQRFKYRFVRKANYQASKIQIL